MPSSVSVAVNPVAILGEAPFWDAATGRVIFVDIIGRRGLFFTPATGALAEIAFPSPVAAVIPRSSGGCIAALAQSIVTLDENGNTAPFAVADTNPDIRTNETRTDAKGRLWISTMQNTIGPNNEDFDVTRHIGTLNRVDADGTVTRFGSGIGIPNTAVWSPDGTKAYFGDSLSGWINVYEFDAETGTASAPRPFFRSDIGVPDGSAMDAGGFLWNARWDGACILRIAPDGTLDRKIPLPAQRVTSCVFGGPDMTTLFITTARVGVETPTGWDGALLQLETGIAGMPCTRFAG